jgi:hypothetical protein
MAYLMGFKPHIFSRKEDSLRNSIAVETQHEHEKKYSMTILKLKRKL